MSYFLERCCLMMTGTSDRRGWRWDTYSYHSSFSLMNYYISSLSSEDSNISREMEYFLRTS